MSTTFFSLSNTKNTCKQHLLSLVSENLWIVGILRFGGKRKNFFFVAKTERFCVKDIFLFWKFFKKKNILKEQTQSKRKSFENSLHRPKGGRTDRRIQLVLQAHYPQWKHHPKTPKGRVLLCFSFSNTKCASQLLQNTATATAATAAVAARISSVCFRRIITSQISNISRGMNVLWCVFYFISLNYNMERWWWYLDGVKCCQC